MRPEARASGAGARVRGGKPGRARVPARLPSRKRCAESFPVPCARVGFRALLRMQGRRGAAAGRRIARAGGRNTRAGRDARGEKGGRLHCERCCLRLPRALASSCPRRPPLRSRARVSRSRVNRIDWTKPLPAETPEPADIDRVNAA